MMKENGDRTYALLIDIGSTSIKWAKTIIEGEPFDEGRVAFPSRLPGPENRHEVSLDAIVKIIMKIIDDNRDASRLLIATQMHGYVLADRDRMPLTNYISWQDRRAKGIDFPFVLGPEFGVGLKENLPRAGIHAIRSLDPVLFDRVSHVFTLGSYIAYLLTERNVTHISDAAPTGYFDATSGRPISTDLELPNAVLDIGPIGTYRGIVVYPPIGDQQASVLGSMADERYYVLNLGTAAQLSTISDLLISGDFETRPYIHRNYLLTVTGLIGGKTIMETGDDELEDRMVQQYEEAIRSLPARERMLVIGGVLDYHKPLIERVMKRLNVPVFYDEQASALRGLSVLNEEVIRMKETIGIMISEIRFENMPLLLKRAGLDLVIIDFEHGPFDFSDLSALIMNARSSEIECIVRLSSKERSEITKIMDMGADGVLLPMTSSALDIREVVRHAKYPPLGKRGISTMRAHAFYAPPEISSYIECANARTRVYAQIETRSGLNRIEDILSEKGVDGAFIGPNDLSADLDCLQDSDAKAIHDAIERVAAVGHEQGKRIGIITRNTNYLSRAKASGIGTYSIGSELSILKDGAKRTLRIIDEV